jgi:hypothetical protein
MGLGGRQLALRPAARTPVAAPPGITRRLAELGKYFPRPRPLTLARQGRGRALSGSVRNREGDEPEPERLSLVERKCPSLPRRSRTRELPGEWPLRAGQSVPRTTEPNAAATPARSAGWIRDPQLPSARPRAGRQGRSVLPSARWRDARGTSLAVTLTVGHLYDVTQLIQLVEAIRPICGRSR